MAEPVSVMQVGQVMAPLSSVVLTTNVTAAADTPNQMVFTTLEAVQVRPPYRYGIVVG